MDQHTPDQHQHHRVGGGHGDREQAEEKLGLCYQVWTMDNGALSLCSGSGVGVKELILIELSKCTKLIDWNNFKL